MDNVFLLPREEGQVWVDVLFSMKRKLAVVLMERCNWIRSLNCRGRQDYLPPFGRGRPRSDFYYRAGSATLPTPPGRDALTGLRFDPVLILAGFSRL